MIKLPVAFIDPPLGAVGFPGEPSFRVNVESADEYAKQWFEAFWKWSSELRSRFMSRLRSTYPDVEFVEYDLRTIDDLNEFLDKESNAVGYVVVDLQGPNFMLNRIAGTGKPIVFIAEALGGGGDYLLNNELIENSPIVAISTRNLDSDAAVGLVRYLVTLAKLKETHVLVVSNRNLVNIIGALSKATGIRFTLLTGTEFVQKYYSKVSDESAKSIADFWIKGASNYPSPDRQYPEVLRSAKLYLAMNMALKDLNANAIAIDCLNLRSNKVLDAWPCLGYMQLWLDGNYVPMCEADVSSLLVALIAKYLLNKAGSATDPVVDDLTGEITYYHCYQPINPAPGVRLRYSIIPSHMGTRYAAVNVEYPVGSELTAVGIDSINKVMYIHVSQIVGNELSLPACGTKVIARADVRTLERRWSPGVWHRVIILGNHRDDFAAMAKLMGFKVVNEDQT